jgi:phosphatidylglycerophosphatase GEP4
MIFPNSNLPAFNLAVSTLLNNPSHFLPNLTISTFLDLPEQLGPHLHPPQQQQQPRQTTGSTNSVNPSSSSSSGSSLSSKAKLSTATTNHHPTIRALVLDKDNTLCSPGTTDFPRAYLRKLESLRISPTSPFNLTSNPHAILIVSNSAGSRPESARYEAEAQQLEKTLAPLKISVFRVPRGGGTTYRKPLCDKEVLTWFQERGVVQRADEIAVVGDRLATDVLLAARMGAWSVWCKDGVTSQTDSNHNDHDNDNNHIDHRTFLAKMETILERYLRENRGLKTPFPEGWGTK